MHFFIYILGSLWYNNSVRQPQHIMEYTVIKSYTLDTLENVVNHFLKNDWECQGGISVIPVLKGSYDQQFFQAMIKTTNKEA